MTRQSVTLQELSAMTRQLVTLQELSAMTPTAVGAARQALEGVIRRDLWCPVGGGDIGVRAGRSYQ